MKKRMTALMVVLMVALAPVAAFAETSNPWTQEDTKGKEALGKFKYGMMNLLFGWTEVFQEPFEAYHESSGKEWNHRAGDTITGLMGGIVYGITDTVGGALDLVTFPATDLSIDLPEGGIQCPWSGKTAAA